MATICFGLYLGVVATQLFVDFSRREVESQVRVFRVIAWGREGERGLGFVALLQVILLGVLRVFLRTDDGRRRSWRLQVWKDQFEPDVIPYLVGFYGGGLGRLRKFVV